MAARGLIACAAALLASVLASACGPAQAPATDVVTVIPPSPDATPSEEPGGLSRFHSKRFRLSVPLPDGKAWKIDDHTQPELVAANEAAGSRVRLLVTEEPELVNRAKCEARARALGWVPDKISTVEDETVTMPASYDSRALVAIETPREGGVTGHVFLFGGWMRSCLLIDATAHVTSPDEETALSDRLAVFRAAVLPGLKIDAPRTRGAR